MSDAAVEALIAPNGALFFGRPETVADKIVALHEQLGIDRFEMHVSHVGHALTMRSIELFGSEVAPLVRERLARATRLSARCRSRSGEIAGLGIDSVAVTALMGLDARLRLARLYLCTDARERAG